MVLTQLFLEHHISKDPRLTVLKNQISFLFFALMLEGVVANPLVLTRSCCNKSTGQDAAIRYSMKTTINRN